MSRFHINEEGKVLPCKAKTIASCTVKSLSGIPRHFTTAEEAQREADSMLRAFHTEVPTFNKKRKKSSLLSDGIDGLDLPTSNHSPKTDYNELTPEQYSKYLELKQVKNYFELPPEDFFLVMSQYNAQAKSGWIEGFIAHKLGMEIVPATLDRGDAKNRKHFFEYKTSTTNKGRNLNMRQIRLYQDVDFYIASYIEELDLKNSYTFMLASDEMEAELRRINGVDEETGMLKGFTHGTVEANRDNPVPEYSLTLPIRPDAEHLKRWVKNYWLDELYDSLLD